MKSLIKYIQEASTKKDFEFVIGELCNTRKRKSAINMQKIMKAIKSGGITEVYVDCASLPLIKATFDYNNEKCYTSIEQTGLSKRMKFDKKNVKDQFEEDSSFEIGWNVFYRLLHIVWDEIQHVRNKHQ